jgi:hypothetical protein
MNFVMKKAGGTKTDRYDIILGKEIDVIILSIKKGLN